MMCRNQSKRAGNTLLEHVNTNERDAEHGGLQTTVTNCTMFIYKIKAEARIVVCTVCCKVCCHIIELIS
jgi:hypothetical protein